MMHEMMPLLPAQAGGKWSRIFVLPSVRLWEGSEVGFRRSGMRTLGSANLWPVQSQNFLYIQIVGTYVYASAKALMSRKC